MKGVKKLIAYGAALASLWSGASLLEAQQYQQYQGGQEFEPWNSVSVSGGWRYDRLHARTHSGSVEGKETFKLKNLNTWQIGGQIHWSVPNFYCDEYWWLSQFYVRGYAYRGWVTSGRLQNRADESDLGISDRSGGKVRNGRTVDANIGVGFLYPISCTTWAIGPVGGWSYEEVHVSSKRRGSSSSSSSSEVGSSASGSSGFRNDHRRFTSRFEGPWIGFDVAYIYSDPCEDIRLRFEGGYEYHWATFRGSARFKGGLLDGVSSSSDRDRFHSNNAWANVAWIQGWWTLCDNIEIGLGLRYHSWEAKRKNNKSSSSSSSLSSSESGGGGARDRRFRRVTWDSVAVNADLGYSF